MLFVLGCFGRDDRERGGPSNIHGIKRDEPALLVQHTGRKQATAARSVGARPRRLNDQLTVCTSFIRLKIFPPAFGQALRQPSGPLPTGILSPDVEEDARKAFIENMPLLEDVNAALERLFQSHFAPSLHITCWIHSCRVFPYPVRSHSCLNPYIACAFPALYDSGAITFSGGACDCVDMVDI